MKKKKIMASLVLSAMMIGTLGTSVSASTWAPNGTDEVTNVSSSGTGSGIGTITHERTEELFLIAVPTNYRKFQFYADPTGNTLQLGNASKIEFANETQDWQFPTNVKHPNATGGHVNAGRSHTSNYITAYNAGSKDVTLNVRAFVSLSDGYGRTVANLLEDGKTPAIGIGVEGNVFATRGYGAGDDNLGMTATDWDDATVDAKDKSLWHIALPGSTPRQSVPSGSPAVAGVDWLERKVVYENDLKYTKDYAVSLEEYNKYAIETSITGTPIPTREEFKYPAASFRLTGTVGGAGDKIWDTKGLTAHLGLKWYITCETSEEPWIDPVVVATKGKACEVEVNLGSGESAMNTVTRVIWDVTNEEAPNGAGFKMDILGTECTYESGSGNNGTLVFKTSALDTLYNYAALNGSTMRVIMSDGVKETAVSFVLWVQ